MLPAQIGQALGFLFLGRASGPVRRDERLAAEDIAVRVVERGGEPRFVFLGGRPEAIRPLLRRIVGHRQRGQLLAAFQGGDDQLVEVAPGHVERGAVKPAGGDFLQRTPEVRPCYAILVALDIFQRPVHHERPVDPAPRPAHPGVAVGVGGDERYFREIDRAREAAAMRRLRHQLQTGGNRNNGQDGAGGVFFSGDVHCVNQASGATCAGRSRMYQNGGQLSTPARLTVNVRRHPV